MDSTLLSKSKQESYTLDGKYLEIIMNIIREQNLQLLNIIADNEKISKKTLLELIPTKFIMKSEILSYVDKQD